MSAVRKPTTPPPPDVVRGLSRGDAVEVAGSRPARLVSLCPSITETLIAFGLRDALVGVTRYCVHPREATAGLHRIGGTKSPDVAAIRALAPDLVLANGEENRACDLAALGETLRVDVTHPRAPGDVPGLLRHLGAITGVPAAGERWALLVEERLAAVRPGPVFTFAYLVWKGPFMVAAAGTYICGLLAHVGGENAFADGAVPYPETSAEELADRQPQVVLLPDEPYRFGVADRDFWGARLPAARVELVPGDDFCWHGVRTLHGLDAVERLARP